MAFDLAQAGTFGVAALGSLASVYAVYRSARRDQTKDRIEADRASWQRLTDECERLGRDVKRIPKLERNLAQLEVGWIRIQAWADEVTLIMRARNIEFPPPPRLADAEVDV